MRRWNNRLVFVVEHLTPWRATDWEVCAVATLDAEGNLVWELRDEVAGRGAYIEALVGHIVDSLGTEPPVLAPGEGKVLYDDTVRFRRYTSIRVKPCCGRSSRVSGTG